LDTDAVATHPARESGVSGPPSEPLPDELPLAEEEEEDVPDELLLPLEDEPPVLDEVPASPPEEVLPPLPDALLPDEAAPDEVLDAPLPDDVLPVLVIPDDAPPEVPPPVELPFPEDVPPLPVDEPPLPPPDDPPPDDGPPSSPPYADSSPPVAQPSGRNPHAPTASATTTPNMRVQSSRAVMISSGGPLHENVAAPSSQLDAASHWMGRTAPPTAPKKTRFPARLAGIFDVVGASGKHHFGPLGKRCGRTRWDSSLRCRTRPDVDFARNPRKSWQARNPGNPAISPLPIGR
jgi:hypothetical protein